ncbi:HlyD family type I secretion periplasmic adaptor subunit [Cognatazoarcus halotolerans]|uniref:HlyD family type I secretion periplasmic adaptor subunit n=1 Tax=Cognatazoarcus halotolerans TaxID=2686016 RepID=UPI0013581BD3|nr:HlyD family type I secretion periplasmic adaptor subunit [Cognatazoarcus halotolerans]MBX3680386.1 HlyD family type I secretion periplasmic adaptor subunit [Rhodocyclaceae bacterium]MCB1898629.1 HlyD family type I secretion periplasmic adaptor subunit [Rhodocyclaceae bacterium]MCP5310844.1 HlyD family type I secretion periplasmic adaptor subunit [Zoogloeaceae bacterium]
MADGNVLEGTPPMVIGEAEALAGIRRWRRIGLVIIAMTFGLAVVWSFLAPLSSAVVAQGLVKVDSNRKRIQHQEGGVVKEILVRDGAHVKAGDVLIRLDETRAGASQGVLRTQRDAALALQARLEAERDRAAEIVWPEELLDRRNDPKVADLIQAQEVQFRARRASLVGQLSILDKQIASKSSEIGGLGGQMRAKQAQLASLRSELAGLTDLLSKGMVEKTKYRNLEREIARLDGERAEHESDIAAARTMMAEKQLEKFQLRKNFHQDVTEDLRKVQTDIFDVDERISAANFVLAQTEIRSPVEGTVTDLKVHTEGGVISPGELLLEVVPADDRLVVEARVRPQDVDRIHVGLPAGIKLSAFDQRTLPELDGAVTYLSADVVEDQRSGQVYYLTRVEVPESQLERLDGLQVLPGMIADVFVRTGERTFFEYLLHPITASFDKAWRER